MVELLLAEAELLALVLPVVQRIVEGMAQVQVLESEAQKVLDL